jgi:hypothetical protein
MEYEGKEGGYETEEIYGGKRLIYRRKKDRKVWKEGSYGRKGV